MSFRETPNFPRGTDLYRLQRQCRAEMGYAYLGGRQREVRATFRALRPKLGGSTRSGR